MGCKLTSLSRYRKHMATLGTLAVSATVAVGVASASSGSGGLGTGGTGPSGGGGGGSSSSDAAFPVRGKVTWGDGLGAGRGHQGQDLLAKCGKAVVAAQPGRVQMRDSHSAAGNYVVIDGTGRRKDTVYMHLLKRASVRKGARVEAGEVIGRVGSTGRASACHLHFEMWSAPGYYEGGSPVNPKPFLRSAHRKR